MLSQDELNRLHELSIENKESVMKSHKCGCFYCKRIFDSDEINQYIMDSKSPTALCPYCLVDAVLCDADTTISMDLLREMSQYYFN